MNNHQKHKHSKQTYFPTEETINKISGLLSDQFQKEVRKSKYAPVKEILTLLGKGLILSAVILAPKSASVLLSLINESPDYESWKRYNISYLKRTLVRLERQKQVEVSTEDGQEIVKLTNNGKRKILKYSLDELKVDKPKKWDGKWRLVLYDIPKSDRKISNLICETLKTIGFYAIQDSVYLYPYPCYDQIEFLREYHGLGNKVQYMMINQIENDQVYKTYFDLK